MPRRKQEQPQRLPTQQGTSASPAVRTSSTLGSFASQRCLPVGNSTSQSAGTSSTTAALCLVTPGAQSHPIPLDISDGNTAGVPQLRHRPFTGTYQSVIQDLASAVQPAEPQQSSLLRTAPTARESLPLMTTERSQMANSNQEPSVDTARVERHRQHVRILRRMQNNMALWGETMTTNRVRANMRHRSYMQQLQAIQRDQLLRRRMVVTHNGNIEGHYARVQGLMEQQMLATQRLAEEVVDRDNRVESIQADILSLQRTMVNILSQMHHAVAPQSDLNNGASLSLSLLSGATREEIVPFVVSNIQGIHEMSASRQVTSHALNRLPHCTVAVSTHAVQVPPLPAVASSASRCGHTATEGRDGACGIDGSP